MKISKRLLNKYNVAVPRYTSYPPANHFTENFSETDYMNLIDQSNHSQLEHIAFYIHIPFCRKICFYCGCNSCTIKSNLVVRNYIKAIREEIKILSKNIDKKRKVSQIHYGGGTPNAIDVSFLEEINNLFFSEFSFIENPEIAIECNPAYLDYEYLDRLLKGKFNRFSIGVQDFNTDVLKAVNRLPSSIPVKEIVELLQNTGSPVSVNLDFIYGLPGQSIESFSETIKQAISIRPDRLVTFSYAHVPWLKKHQQILEKKGLPASDEKIRMHLVSHDLLKKAGYVPVGLDHYVLPGDELNLALINQQLHRNFQGYCTRRTTGQVYAFGVTAISQLEKGYSQNSKNIDYYIEMLEKGKLPVEKGYSLSFNQMIIREAITELMCNKQLDLYALATKFSLSVKELEDITGFTRKKLNDFLADDLVEFDMHKLTVNEKGSLFIRNIATIFDPGYKLQDNKYSKSV